MATTSEALNDSQVSARAESRLAFLPLALTVSSAVFLGLTAFAAIGFYLVKSGHIALPQASVPVVKVVDAPTATRQIILDPIVANLSDSSGTSFLKLALVFKVADESPAKPPATEKEKAEPGKSAADAPLRDTVFSVVAKQTAAELLGPDGKKQLKDGLRSALAEHNPEIKVLDIFFTEFLVQR